MLVDHQFKYLDLRGTDRNGRAVYLVHASNRKSAIVTYYRDGYGLASIEKFYKPKDAYDLFFCILMPGQAWYRFENDKWEQQNNVST